MFSAEPPSPRPLPIHAEAPTWASRFTRGHAVTRHAAAWRVRPRHAHEPRPRTSRTAPEARAPVPALRHLTVSPSPRVVPRAAGAEVVSGSGRRTRGGRRGGPWRVRVNCASSARGSGVGSEVRGGRGRGRRWWSSGAKIGARPVDRTPAYTDGVAPCGRAAARERMNVYTNTSILPDSAPAWGPPRPRRRRCVDGSPSPRSVGGSRRTSSCGTVSPRARPRGRAVS